MNEFRQPGDGEVLTGAKAIADKFGFTRRQIYHYVETAGFPVFHIGRTLCARPWQVRQWLAEQEAAAKAEAASRG